MARPEKVEKVEEIKDLFANAGSFFITDYQGLNVADITTLRKNLRENDVRYMVAKNTMFLRGAKEAGKEGLDEFFSGPTAVAFAADDPTVAAKVLHDSYKDKDLPRIKVFVIKDEQQSPERLKDLADLPTKDTLYAMVAAAVEAPMTNLAMTVNGFFQELVGSIEALAQQKQSEG